MASTMRLAKCRTIGNEFIVIDNRERKYDDLLSDVQFKHFLCDRLYGLGAIGIMEIRSHDTCRYESVYHMGSGERGPACGSGCRSTVAWAHHVGLITPSEEFEMAAYDAIKKVSLSSKGLASTTMCKTPKITVFDENNYCIDNGFLIHVRFIEEDVLTHDVVKEGYKITEDKRYNYRSDVVPPVYQVANVLPSNEFKVSALDRCVDANQPLTACGTGSYGVAIAHLVKQNLFGEHEFTVKWRVGDTIVKLTREQDDTFNKNAVIGEVQYLFDMDLDVSLFKKSYSTLEPYKEKSYTL